MFVIRLRTLICAVLIGVISVTAAAFAAVWICDSANAPGLVMPADTKAAVELPILMYHSLTDKSSKINTYTVLVNDFEADLKFIKEHGYTTVLLSEVIDYVDGKANLPEKPIVLTFDDGFRNNLVFGLPLLEKYDMKAVISVVGSYCEMYADCDDKNPDYSYLDWEDINTLKESGRVEIDNHTYNMHMLPGEKENKDARKGASQKINESSEVYKSKLIEDAEKVQNLLSENCGISPQVFTYPYGELCKTSEAALKEIGFRATLSCMEKMNYISVGNNDCLYCMCRFLRSNKKSAAAILKQ
ncbi:MAG: polysaccharide deacetylase family protein [Clostridiales bacterium]|nr:polysaccharide deacetylase family protein [Clostridiales bacterium]